MREACALGLEVIDRCNLTVLLEPGQEDLVNFLARHQVHILPVMASSFRFELSLFVLLGVPLPVLTESLESGLAHIDLSDLWDMTS